MPVAVITGASKGLGLALAGALAGRGWDLVVDARAAGPLAKAARELRGAGSRVVALPGDVADGGHRTALVSAAGELGGLDLLVNNASALGAEPLVRLAELPAAGLRRALEVNVVAPLELIKEALPLLRNSSYFSYPPSYVAEAPYIGEAPFRGDEHPAEAYDPHPYSENSQNTDLSVSHPYVGVHGAVLTLSSDAAVEAYPTWGGYGASKAALDQLSAVLAVEEPGLRVWWVDPGDMRTDLYAAAVPDDDGSGRPLPQTVVPALLRLLDGAAASGRYTAADLTAAPDGASSR
ncbi:SDR family NAD(P)-dependent oxidoreductase [Streptomyces sp. NPDC058989]|uniref:SDR family NAD(P)-dependent oxidoreductase n=1 Tax=Streptomyces sp. NPDC058989 TaxID=3346686 RepID=UPI00368C0B26